MKLISKDMGFHYLKQNITILKFLSLPAHLLQKGVVGGLFLALLLAQPFLALAVVYQPGETLNPACLPTDSGCGVAAPLTASSTSTLSLGGAAPNGSLFYVAGTSTLQNIIPAGNLQYSVGSPESRLQNVYTNNLILGSASFVVEDVGGALRFRDANSAIPEFNIDPSSGTTVNGNIFINGGATFANATTTGSHSIGGAFVLGGQSFQNLVGAGLRVASSTLALDNSGDWAGTFDGQEASYFFANSFSTSSANLWLSGRTTDNLTEGANLYYTDARSRNALSSSALGLTYATSTGAFSLISGYNIPLMASTTAWNNFYNTPSSRVTAGTGLAWIANTLGVVGNLATTTINGASGPVFTFNTGTAGSDFTISTSTSTNTLTFNLPSATSAVRGLLTAADWTIFNNKENALATGTSMQYYRGDKTFQTLDTSVVPENGNVYYTDTRFDNRLTLKTTNDLTEGSNLYYTDARARSALSATAPISYSTSTGVSSLTTGNITAPSNPEIMITGGGGAVIGIGVNIAIPEAGTATRGLVSTTTQTFVGDKTFSGASTLATTTASSLTLSPMTQGSLLFAGAGGLMSQNNSNLFWDNTNSRLGIGTTTPVVKLEVAQNEAIKMGDGFFSSGGDFLNISTNNWFNGTVWSSNYENRQGSTLQLTAGDAVFFSSTAGIGVPTFTERMTIKGSGPLAGNVGIGDTSPAAMLTVGNGDLFQVNSSGNIVNLGGAAHSVNNSLGALVIDSAGAGALNIGTGANGKTITLGNTTGATGLVFNSGSGNINFDGSTLYIDTVNNNIGIGTASPSAKLHLVGSELVNSQAAAVGAGTTQRGLQVVAGALGANDGTIRGIDISATVAGTTNIGDELTGLRVETGAIDSNGTTRGLHIYQPSTVSAYTSVVKDLLTLERQGGTLTNALQYVDAGATKFAITAGGNVGVNTASPNGARLEIINGVSTEKALRIVGASSQSDDYFLIEKNGGSDIFSVDQYGTIDLKPTSNAGAILVDGGNVTSGGLLDLKSYDRQNSTTNRGILSIRGNASTLTGALTGQSIDMTAVNTGTSNTQQGLLVLMNNAGSGQSIGVDIQGAASGTNLVDTALKISNAQTAIDFSDATSNINVAGTLNFDTNTLFVDATNNRVGIGTTTPDLRFHVSNTGQTGAVARFTDDNGFCDIDPTSTALVCTSDISLKKNILTLDNSLEKVLALNPVSFNWNKEENDAAKHFGFVAQEVEELFPALVFTNEQGIKSVAYTNFAPILIKAIQEIASLGNTFRGTLIAWFADAANGIGDLFAGRVHTEKICLRKADGSEFCVGGDELEEVMSNRGGTYIVQQVAGDQSTLPIQTDSDAGAASSTQQVTEDPPLMIAADQISSSESVPATEVIIEATSGTVSESAPDLPSDQVSKEVVPGD